MSIEFTLKPVEKKDVEQTKLAETDESEGGECVDYSGRNERQKKLYDRLWTARARNTCMTHTTASDRAYTPDPTQIIGEEGGHAPERKEHPKKKLDKPLLQPPTDTGKYEKIENSIKK